MAATIIIISIFTIIIISITQMTAVAWPTISLFSVRGAWDERTRLLHQGERKKDLVIRSVGKDSRGCGEGWGDWVEGSLVRSLTHQLSGAAQ